MTFPASFMLVAAMNPCPCGHYGNPRRECRCSPVQVERYRSRLSGPLLDRIDIHIEVPAIEMNELTSAKARAHNRWLKAEAKTSGYAIRVVITASKLTIIFDEG